MQIIALSSSDVFLRLFIATLLGLILGIERTLAGKVAGMRTFSLVGLGSALFTVVSLMVASQYSNINPLDTFRITTGILVGIGFIGAGLVVFKGDQVTGLTSAAGLWVTAAVGMAAGYGLYSVALFTTGLALFVFTVLWIIERDFVDRFQKKIDSSEQ